MLNKLFDKHVILPNALSNRLLKGDVKEVITRFEKANMEFDEYHKQFYNDLFFDASGNLREEITYSNYDKIDQSYKYNYDLKNQLITEIRVGLGKFTINYKYKYRKNKIIVSRYLDGDKSEKDDFKKVILLKNGSIISITTTSTFPKRMSYEEYQNGKLVIAEDQFFKTCYEYDILGNIKVEKYFGLGGSIFKVRTYDYNSENELISHTETNFSGEILNKCKYTLDNQKNWIRKEIINEDNSKTLVVTRSIKYYK